MKNIENLEAYDFMYAMINGGAEPVYIEDIELAEDVMRDFESVQYRDVYTPENGEDFEWSCRQLDLDPQKTRVIYYCHNWNEEGFKIAFSEDWDY